MVMHLRMIWTIVGGMAALFLGIIGVLELRSPVFLTPVGAAALVVLAIYLAINCGLLWNDK